MKKEMKETAEVKAEKEMAEKERREKLLATLERKARKGFLQDVKEYERCLYTQAAYKELELIKEKMQALEKRLRRLKGSSTSTSSMTTSTSTSSMTTSTLSVDFRSIACALNGSIEPKRLDEKSRKAYQKIRSYLYNYNGDAWNLTSLKPENVTELEGWKRSTVKMYWEHVKPLM
jgi:hypothetical protein